MRLRTAEEIGSFQQLQIFVGLNGTGCAVQPPGRGLLNEVGAFEQLAADVLPGVEFRAKGVHPGAKSVDPGFDGELLVAKLGDDERGAPLFFVARRQRDLHPVGVTPILQDAGDHVVTVGKDVSGHVHRLTLRPLDRESTVVSRRLQVLDDYTGQTSARRLRWRFLSHTRGRSG